MLDDNISPKVDIFFSIPSLNSPTPNIPFKIDSKSSNICWTLVRIFTWKLISTEDLIIS